MLVPKILAYVSDSCQYVIIFPVIATPLVNVSLCFLLFIHYTDSFHNMFLIGVKISYHVTSSTCFMFLILKSYMVGCVIRMTKSSSVFLAIALVVPC